MSDPSQLLIDQPVGLKHSSVAESATQSDLRTATSGRSRAVRVVWVIGPLMFGVLLFVLNNLATLSGWLNPPEKYVAVLVPRAQDTATYLTLSLIHISEPTRLLSISY